MTVGTDDERLFPLLQRGVDRAEEVLARCQFDTDVLSGIAIVLAYFREDGFCILHTGVKEGINLEPFAYLFL